MSSAPTSPVSSTWPSAGQDKANLTALVFLVAGHGLEQARGIEPRGRRRQAETHEQRDQPVGDLGSDPAQVLGHPALGDHAGGHGLAVQVTAAVAGNRFDRVADGMAEIEDRAAAGLFAFVAGDDVGLELARAGDDRAQGVVLRSRMASALASRKAKNAASRMTPYLTTSASPHRSSRGGSVSSVAVSIQTPEGWWKAPMMFLARGWLIPTLPPTALSTWASKLVGTIRRGRPRA